MKDKQKIIIELSDKLTVTRVKAEYIKVLDRLIMQEYEALEQSHLPALAQEYTNTSTLASIIGDYISQLETDLNGLGETIEELKKLES